MYDTVLKGEEVNMLLFVRRTWAGFLACALLVVGTPDADAAFVMALDDLGTAGVDVIIVDNMAIGTGTTKGLSNTADGQNAFAGFITFSGAVGIFNINVTTALSKPVIGMNRIDLTSVSVTGGAGHLNIMVTDTDFFLPGQQQGGLWISNLLGGTTDGTINTQGFLDEANMEFKIGGGPIHSTTLLGDGPGAFSSTTTTFVNPLANPWSLTENVNIFHTGAGQVTSFDKELNAVVGVVGVPEPTSLLLLGAGLLGLSAGLRRRKKKTQ